MNTYTENNINFNIVMVLGDTHGNNMNIAPILLQKYRLNNNKETKCILQVGDFGMGFTKLNGEKIYLKRLNDRLKKYNTYLYVIRGNHDDPQYFNDEVFKEKNGINNFSNIKLLKDHTLLSLKINGDFKKVYCIGGAYSIDRSVRTQGDSYWSDEKFVLPSLDERNKIGEVDVVITHTRPTGVWPLEKLAIQHWIMKDSQLYYDLDWESGDMKTLFDTLKSNNTSFKHFYGHFHSSKVEYLGEFKHQCVGIDELVEVQFDI
tara:strand:- start:238 stop:1020 length:783 start_codon:yes stop_codon:yes gene_type:complete